MSHIKSGCYSATTKLYMIRLYRSLNEKDRRHYAAVEAQKLGHGCIKYIANLLGCSCQTIHTALSEMKKNQLNSETRVRSPGGGRKAQENKATVVKTFQAIIEPHVAGDPMNQEIRWLKISRAEISEKMKAAGICVSRNIISKLLKKHGFVKRKLQRKRAGGQHADRNQQFEIITNKKLHLKKINNRSSVLIQKKRTFRTTLS